MQNTRHNLGTQETVAVIITIIILKVIQNLMNDLEGKNNTKPIKAKCLHPGAMFTHLEKRL